MRPSDRDLKQLGPWPAGANNLSAEHSVPSRSFREGINVIVADDGKVSRIDGYTKVYDGYEPHSVIGYGARGFFVDQTELLAVELYSNGTLSEPLTVFAGLQFDAPLAHCLIEPDIYVSDGQLALRISPQNVVSPWSLPMPATPTAALSAGGTLQPGRYQFALSYRAVTGEEGPLSGIKTVDVAEGQQVTLGFPAGDAAHRVLVYMTKANGTELLLYESKLGTSTSALVNQTRALGRPSPTNGLEQMPAGRFAAYFAGRLLVAVYDALVWSEPMHYGLTAFEYNYTLFSEPITGIGVIGENTDGFFVGQLSRTYFVRGGNPAEAQPAEVYPAGMVPGTLTHVPGARLPLENPPTVPVPVWLATNGVLCAGLQDGTVLPLNESRFAANVGSEGASVFEQRGGVSRVVVTTRNPSDNDFAVTDSVSIEVVRNGMTP